MIGTTCSRRNAYAGVREVCISRRLRGDALCGASPVASLALLCFSDVRGHGSH